MARSLCRASLATVSAVLSRRNVAAETAELLTARLRGGERGLSPGRYHLSFGLRDNRHDTHDHFVRLRHVGGNELDASSLQSDQEVSVTRQPVELRNDELRPVSAAERQRLGELRPIILGA